MLKNIFILLVGCVYGSGFYAIFTKSFFGIRRQLLSSVKPQTGIKLLLCDVAVTILVCSLSGAFILTILFFSRYFKDWQSFLKIWVIGFGIGALVVKSFLK